MRQLMRRGSVTTQHLARILAMPVTFDTAKVFRTTGTLIYILQFVNKADELIS